MIYSLENLDSFIERLIELIGKKDIIVILKGDLASGKTTLVKRFVQLLGDDTLVTSPTFALQSIYGDSIFHYDLYNKGIEEFIALGMLEEFEKSGIHFVEWGDEKLKSLLKDYGFEVMVINIEKKEDVREYTIA